jgi:hypothetical protein
VKVVASSTGCHLFQLLVVPCKRLFIKCCLLFSYGGFDMDCFAMDYLAMECLPFDMEGFAF